MSILKFIYCVGVMTKTQIDVGDLLSTQCEKHRAINCAYLRKVLENVIFLARWGLPRDEITYQLMKKVVA